MILTLTLLAFAAAMPSAQEPDVCDHVTRNVWDPRFAPGQRWSYRSRPVDAGSTLIITNIDDVPGVGVVVHIDVDDVDFTDRPPVGQRINGSTRHITLRRDSLDASALQMLGIVALPNDDSSYLVWHLNCIGLTHATTVADTLDALQAQYCAEVVKTKTTMFVPACAPAPNRAAKPRSGPTPSPPSAPPSPNPGANSPPASPPSP